jgi:hypothetical protein
MKTSLIATMLLVLFMISYSCSDDDDDVDKQNPVIDLSSSNAFPNNCDTLYFGESFDFKVFLSDNEALGSYSIDIHNNFDHHSHSTEVEECNLDDKKEPVNPYLFIQEFSIPESPKEYETNRPIEIPDGDGKGAFDEGDYHFFISVTDKTGWTAQKGLSIKILRR